MKTAEQEFLKAFNDKLWKAANKLRKSTTIDWQVHDSVRAKLKILVRHTLQRYKYPPDKAAKSVELVLKQAETLSNSWSK